jgi:AcrR family transcriptional regulator
MLVTRPSSGKYAASSPRHVGRSGVARAEARVSRKPPAVSLKRPLVPRKLPQQERAQETVGAILKAAAAAFARDGYACTTTNHIAERAGVSVGSLYQYFPNKDAILGALYERHTADVDVAVERALAEMTDTRIPLHRALTGLLERLQDLHDEDPDLMQAASQQAVHVPRVVSYGRKHKEDHVDRVERVLRGRSDVRTGDQRVMARVLVQAMDTLMRWIAHELPPGPDRRAASEEVVTMLARYLQR